MSSGESPTENRMISRQEAKSNGLTRYFTGEPCKRGHISERCVSNKHCIKCLYEKKRIWKRANRDKIKSQNRTHYSKHREKILTKKNSVRSANKEKSYAQYRAYYLANPSIYTALTAKRNARKIRATPPWLTQEHINLMKWIYRLREIHERIFGGKWHVDHIVPLQGQNVCGLHVPWNLQVIEAEKNIKKHNKLAHV